MSGLLIAMIYVISRCLASFHTDAKHLLMFDRHVTYRPSLRSARYSKHLLMFDRHGYISL